MKVWFKFVLIIFLAAFVYRDSFTARFFQDDKLNLELAASKDFLAVIPGANHYRPVSVQGFYLLGETVSGLNPIGYHLIEFAIFAGTLFLIYKISRSFLVLFLYALNISLFANFFWIANSQFVLGAFFFFLAFWLFQKKSWLTIPIFVLGLLSNEQILTLLPLTVITAVWFKEPFSLKLFTLLCIISSLWIVFRIFNMPVTSDYTLVFSPLKTGATFRWYVLRALNLPEGVKLTFVVLVPLLILIIPKQRPDFRVIIYGLAWFITTLGVFLFLPGHLSAHYLTVPLFGSTLLISQLLPKNKVLLWGCLLIYVLQTLTGLNFLSRTHWIILKNTGPIGQF